VAERLRGRGVPFGLAPDAGRLRDVTEALSKVYPAARPPASTQRGLRSRLRAAAGRLPGALLLDHVRGAGSAMKGFLRSLRGTRLGVAFAADAENRTDHESVRRLRLTHRELVVPPLAGRWMTQILRDLLARKAPRHGLLEDDRRSLIRLARGRPGRLAAFVVLLSEARFWRGGRVSTGALETAASEQVLHRYLARSGSG